MSNRLTIRLIGSISIELDLETALACLQTEK